MDREEMRKALSRAFNYGQTYFAQSDSESYSQNKRADKTWADYERFVEETIAAVAHSCELARNELHRDIMNLPCKGPALPLTQPEQKVYALGYRDARHAAAELALATLSRHGG